MRAKLLLTTARGPRTMMTLEEDKETEEVRIFLSWPVGPEGGCVIRLSKEDAKKAGKWLLGLDPLKPAKVTEDI